MGNTTPDRRRLHHHVHLRRVGPAAHGHRRQRQRHHQQPLRRQRLPADDHRRADKADDVRVRRAGQRHQGHRRAGKETTQTYDTFGRPLEPRCPEGPGRRAVHHHAGADLRRQRQRHRGDRTERRGDHGRVRRGRPGRPTMLAPIDEAGDPQRKTSFHLRQGRQPAHHHRAQGQPDPDDPSDFITTNAYDEIYQLDPGDQRRRRPDHRTQYDNVGNVIKVVDPRKNATADPTTTPRSSRYDREPPGHQGHRRAGQVHHHRPTTATAWSSHRRTRTGNTILITWTPAASRPRSKVPHVDNGGIDLPDHQVRVRPGRQPDQGDQPAGRRHHRRPGRLRTGHRLRRAEPGKETRTAFDRDDARYTTPDKTTYTYDDVGRLAKVSAPPSSGETVRNDTTYTYFDNGWTKTSTDPWDIVTSYDYNALGQQTSRDADQRGRFVEPDDDLALLPGRQAEVARGRRRAGRPAGGAGRQLRLQNVATTGTWRRPPAPAPGYGHDYATHAAGTGTDTFTWQLNVPQAGTYEVFVRYPPVAGAATDARVHRRRTHGGTDGARRSTRPPTPGTWVASARSLRRGQRAQGVTVGPGRRAPSSPTR